MSSPKELTELIKEATNQGWIVMLTKGSHYKWISPFGGFFFSGSTPSDHRALKNIKRDLKNNGFITITKKERRDKR